MAPVGRGRFVSITGLRNTTQMPKKGSHKKA